MLWDKDELLIGDWQDAENGNGAENVNKKQFVPLFISLSQYVKQYKNQDWI